MTGQRWPPVAVRREMLEEAAPVIRLLWRGGMRSHHGRYSTVENARIYTLPREPPPIYAAGPASSELAARIGDGLIAVAPQEGTVRRLHAAGGMGKPCIGQVHVCWAASETDARRLAHAVWPNAAIPGQLGQELALASYFEQAAEPLREEDVARVVVCGPDPEPYATASAPSRKPASTSCRSTRSARTRRASSGSSGGSSCRSALRGPDRR